MKHELTTCFKPRPAIYLLSLAIVTLAPFTTYAVSPQETLESRQRIQHLIDSLKIPDTNKATVAVTETLQVNDCSDYPYHNNTPQSDVMKTCLACYFTK